MGLDGVPSLESCPSELTWKDKISVLVKGIGELPQEECPLKHYFAPHVYIREIFMPAGLVVIGKIHKTEHFNIIQKGKVSIVSEDETKVLEGPCTFISAAGVQKVLYIHEDTIWSTVHVTENRDLESLEAELIEPDESYPILDRYAERIAIAKASEGEKPLLEGHSL